MLMTRYYFNSITPSGVVLVSVPCSKVAYDTFLSHFGQTNSDDLLQCHSIRGWVSSFLAPSSYRKVSDYLYDNFSFSFSIVNC